MVLTMARSRDERRPGAEVTGQGVFDVAAVHEATNPSTQSLERSGSAGTIGAETPPFTTRKPLGLPLTFFSPQLSRCHLTIRGVTSQSATSNNPNKPARKPFPPTEHVTSQNLAAFAGPQPRIHAHRRRDPRPHRSAVRHLTSRFSRGWVDEHHRYHIEGRSAIGHTLITCRDTGHVSFDTFPRRSRPGATDLPCVTLWRHDRPSDRPRPADVTFGHMIGSNVDARSRGTSISTGPISCHRLEPVRCGCSRVMPSRIISLVADMLSHLGLQGASSTACQPQQQSAGPTKSPPPRRPRHQLAPDPRSHLAADATDSASSSSQHPWCQSLCFLPPGTPATVGGQLTVVVTDRR